MGYYGRRRVLMNTVVWLWTRLHCRKVCHEDRHSNGRWGLDTTI